MSNSSDNMDEDRIITVCPEQLSTTPTRESSSSSNDVVISVDEISVYMEEITDVTPPEEADLSGEMGQCRFCHEEDLVSQLEAPCACTGSLKYAHRSCTIGWCTAKGDTICEICEQPYGPDYAVSVIETSSSQTRDVPSTPTTVTHVQNPLQQPDQRVAALHQWTNLIPPSRSVLYATLIVLFLLALIVNDIFSFTKTPKKERKIAFNTIFAFIMMVVAPVSLLSCLYEFLTIVRGHTEERNRTASGRANGGRNPGIEHFRASF